MKKFKKYKLFLMASSFFVLTKFGNIALASESAQNVAELRDNVNSTNPSSAYAWMDADDHAAFENELRELEKRYFSSPSLKLSKAKEWLKERKETKEWNQRQALQTQQGTTALQEFEATVNPQNYPWMDEADLAAYRVHEPSTDYSEFRRQVKETDPHKILAKKKEWLKERERTVTRERAGNRVLQEFEATVNQQSYSWMDERDLAEYQAHQPKNGYGRIITDPSRILEKKKEWLQNRKWQKERNAQTQVGTAALQEFEATVTRENYRWMSDADLVAYRTHKPSTDSFYGEERDPHKILAKKKEWLKDRERAVTRERTGTAALQEFEATVTRENYPWMDEADLKAYQAHKPTSTSQFSFGRELTDPMQILEGKKEWLKERERTVTRERTGNRALQEFELTVNPQNYPWMDEADLKAYQAHKPSNDYGVSDERDPHKILAKKKEWLKNRKSTKEWDQKSNSEYTRLLTDVRGLNIEKESESSLQSQGVKKEGKQFSSAEPYARPVAVAAPPAQQQVKQNPVPSASAPLQQLAQQNPVPPALSLNELIERLYIDDPDGGSLTDGAYTWTVTAGSEQLAAARHAKSTEADDVQIAPALLRRQNAGNIQTLKYVYQIDSGDEFFTVDVELKLKK